MRLWDLVLNAEVGTQFVLCDLHADADWHKRVLTISDITDEEKNLSVIFFRIDGDKLKVYSVEETTTQNGAG